METWAFKRKIKNTQGGKDWKKDDLFDKARTDKSLTAFFNSDPCYCHGHGNYTYFNPEKDFYFVKVQQSITTITKKYRMKIDRKK